jgi:hypothetical protein
VISNNILANNRVGLILYGSAGCTPGLNTVDNNVIVNNSAGGIFDATPPPGNCSSGRPILFSHNILFGNSFNQSSPQSCETRTSTLSENPITTFVNYSGDASGDYHLKAGSIAIGGGTNTCVAGGQSPCVPTTDFFGTSITTQPIGAVTSGSGGGGVGAGSISPASLDFGTRVPLQGCSLPQTATFMNTGTGNLTLTNELLSAQSDFQFGNVGSCTVGQTLQSGQLCTVSGKSCPSQIGSSLSANVVISHTAPNSPQTVTFTGSGANPPAPSNLTITVQ